MAATRNKLPMMRDPINRWEFVIFLAITLAGWAFTAGTVYAHQAESEKRIDRIENKVDTILELQRLEQ